MAKRKDKPDGKSKAQPKREANRTPDTEPDAKPVSSYLRRYGIDSVWAHLALNLASVLMLTLAFPKPGWSVMAFFAPVPIGVLAMRSTRLWTLTWTTMLVFAGWWSLRIYWLTAVSPGAPWGVGLVVGLYMTLAVVALAQVQRRYRAAMTLTLPVFWVAQEAVRSVWPWGGFPWFTLGSSQAMSHPVAEAGLGVPFPGGYLVQTADLFGVLTVSFLVAMTAGLIVDLIARPMTKRNDKGKSIPRRTVVVGGGLWLVCFGGAMVYGMRAVDATGPPWAPGGPPYVPITVIQTNVPQSNKQEGSSEALMARRMADWDRLFDLTESAISEHPDTALVVWPETMVLRPINDESYAHGLPIRIGIEEGTVDASALSLEDFLAADGVSYRDRIDRFAALHDVHIMAGGRAFLVDGDPRLMNSAFLVEPGAESYPRYSKQQLVPFGEYVPGPRWIRDWFHKYLSPYDYDYTLKEGERPVVFEFEVSGGNAPSWSPTVDTLRFATPICFEDVVGHLCRDMVYGQDGTKRVDVLVNITNDGWFAGTHQGWQHLQIATLRCIENRVPMVRSVNTGVSGYIDSAGRVREVVSVSGKSQEVDGYMTVNVVLDGRTTLYARVGEAGPIGIGLTAVLLWLGTWVPSRSARREESAAG